MQWDDPEAGRKRLGLLQKQRLFNMRPYMRPPAAKLSFQIGVRQNIPNGQLPVDGRLPDKSAFAYSLMRHLNTFDTMYVSAGS